MGSPAAAVDKVIYLSGEHVDLSPILLNHELIHIAQQTRDGLDTYEYNYFVKWQDIPYHLKDYEVEAFKYCQDLNYIENVYGYIMELESVQNNGDDPIEPPPQITRFRQELDKGLVCPNFMGHS